MTSSLFKATTYHKRFSPKEHSFTYRVLYFLLDLDEINLVSQKINFFGYNKPNIYSFNDKDHALKGQQTLKESIALQVKKTHPDFQIASISLLTHARTFGFLFNPVCFYFIKDSHSQGIILIEVMNTYYEHKNFITDIFKLTDDKFIHSQVFDKSFYVSPFSSSKGSMEYTFRCDLEDKIFIGVKNFENGSVNVFADINGVKANLTNSSLFKSIFLYPLLTMKVWLAIHFHAFILYLKKIRFYRKNEEIDSQKGYDLWKKK